MAWNRDHLQAARFHLDRSEEHAREALQVVDSTDPDYADIALATARTYTLQGIHHALMAQVHLGMPALPPATELESADEHP